MNKRMHKNNIKIIEISIKDNQICEIMISGHI